MSNHLLETAAVLLVLAAALGLFNERVLRLPYTIGLLVSALGASLLVLGFDALVPQLGWGDAVRHAVEEVDFSEALLGGMLGFLLFAGSLHVNLEELIRVRAPIVVLASVGVLVSTVIVGFGSWGMFSLLGIDIGLPYCLVFGALISPTDPIAVLSIMKSVGAPKSLETKVAGESLFNDGIGVIVFTVLVGIAAGSTGHGGPAVHGIGHGAETVDTAEAVEAVSIATIFLREVGGGILLGLLGGLVAYGAMRLQDEPNLEILFSVALVTALIALALRLHTSAPLACVVAGLFIGNRGRRFAMSVSTRESLDQVWEFLDETLNAVLFLLVGLEVVAITFQRATLAAALLAIPLALLARFVSVALPISALRLQRSFTPGAVRVLTWGGLKGGISVALALSLPQFPGRDAVITATYAVVVFSIVVQGLSVGNLIRSVSVSKPSSG